MSTILSKEVEGRIAAHISDVLEFETLNRKSYVFKLKETQILHGRSVIETRIFIDCGWWLSSWGEKVKVFCDGDSVIFAFIVAKRYEIASFGEYKEVIRVVERGRQQIQESDFKRFLKNMTI